MNARRAGIGLLAGLALCLGLASQVNAGGKGGGKPGGGGNPPPGTIYYTYQGSVWSMDGGGGNQTQLPLAEGEPSYALHGDRDGNGTDDRWFLYQSGGGIYAAQENNLWNAYLVDAVGEGIAVQGQLRWAKDDSFLSYAGIDGTGLQSIFQVAVDWSTGDPIATSTSGLVVQSAGVHDWSPDGTQVVYGLHVAGDDTARQMFVHSVYDNPDGSNDWLLTTTWVYHSHRVEWSPDGLLIAFGDFAGNIRTVGSDGVNPSETVVVPWEDLRRGQWIAYYVPYWSPDTGHLGIYQDDNRARPTLKSGVATVKADGGSKKLIGPLFSVPIGWR